MSTRRRRSTGPTAAADGTDLPQQDFHAPPEPAEVAAPPDDSTAEERIREAAYFLAEQRGFTPGHELEDWLAAEEAVRAACEGSAVPWSSGPNDSLRAGARSARS
jgi:hypothetical protein